MEEALKTEAEARNGPLSLRSLVSGGLLPKLLLSLAFGLLVYVVLAAYGDVSQMLAVFGRFHWGLLPTILGLTFFNYILRCLKWHFYLGQIGVKGIGYVDSFLLYFSGLSMVVTPGKLGEWLKSLLLKEITGTPFSRSAPIIVAERLTDGLALVVLAMGGLVIFRQGWEVAVAMAALTGLVVFITQNRRLAFWLISWGERVPLLSGQLRHLHAFYESSYTLFGLRNMAVTVALGVVSWSGECLAFYLVLVGLGLDPSPLLVLQSAFILATATLAASLFLTPGGLGVAEGGITAFCQVLLGMPKDLAAVATLIIRFCTLWFGVLVGVVGLLIFSRRLGRSLADDLEADRKTRRH